MRLLLASILILGCSILFAQETLTILPLKLSVSPSYNARLFTKKSTKRAKDKRLAEKAETLEVEFQQYADEVMKQFEIAYGPNINFLSSEEAIPDSLRFEYMNFMGSIDQAIYRNQRKKDDGPLTVSVAAKGQSNKALKEKNETSLKKTSEPFVKHFSTNLFLSVKVIGMQNSPLKSNGIYGGIRIQVILIEADTGATVFFKTFSRGTMKTMKWDSKNGNVPPSATSVRKSGFQGRLENMLKAGIDKANKLAAKG
jgi:hypothetical protein